VNSTDPKDDLTSGDGGALGIGVAGALARQYADDTKGFLSGLAALLESAAPDETTVKRAGLFGGDTRPVRRIDLVIGSNAAEGETVTRYGIEDASGKGGLTASRTQVVRGIALKTQTVAVESWIAEVSEAIARRADRHKATRDALHDLLL